MSRAEYGKKLVREWSKNFTRLYGANYSYANMARFKQFYLEFPIVATVWRQLTWSHIKLILPIKDENKRNYYINLTIENGLGVRDLNQEIKSSSYERLVSKPSKIEIQSTFHSIKIDSNVKNPIIIYLKQNEEINNEHDLQMKILTNLQVIFRQLGNGYSLIGNEYKIIHNGTNYFIDMLLFNYKLNRFVVIELKTRELRKEDKSQVKFYMELVDENIKEPFHNNTPLIIITKEQDTFIATFVIENDIIPITSELKKV